MRAKSLFEIFLMFLFTIGFTSCSDDDKQEYSLKLSQISCEVMQGYSVTIGLTAHENTTLNIEAPELIDAVYIWESDGNKAEIEIKGKQKGETDLVVTDHETGESATIKVKVTEYPMPHLAVKQPKGNIFDMMNFYLYNEDSKPINSNNLSAVCDSIVWTADGVDGSFKVFEYGEGDGWVDNHLTLEWGHCFKYPGEYKTNLTAWKDNKVISRHELAVTITDGKDFLAYNWTDITKDSQAWDTYVDVLQSSPDWMTTYGLSGTVPFVEVRVFSSDNVLKFHTFYDYFCKLYSLPTYEDKTDKQKMWQLYDELFSEQKKYDSAYPVAIWVAERANIVLLLLDESTEFPGYVVYAEPKKQ
ncbi:hypothetical protein [Parabacteroides bouchesdurhonensis]|uniref:hypothetical protein n=1 Tax=Parabacteroides bouchesdurhonensis TaxID=1936995 RepID=UPI000E4E1AD0|nr:hypothetical protein [Parabacteroides bouchesdurhonensis]RHJ92519.1 hypothetical protein DW095_07690 [Bacteroides sp. AM07-16]